MRNQHIQTVDPRAMARGWRRAGRGAAASQPNHEDLTIAVNLGTDRMEHPERGAYAMSELLGVRLIYRDANNKLSAQDVRVARETGPKDSPDLIDCIAFTPAIRDKVMKCFDKSGNGVGDWARPGPAEPKDWPFPGRVFKPEGMRPSVEHTVWVHQGDCAWVEFP